MGVTVHNFDGTRVVFSETVSHFTTEDLAPKGWRSAPRFGADKQPSRRISFLGIEEVGSLDFSKLNHALTKAGFAVVSVPPQASAEVVLGEAKGSTVVVSPTTVGLLALTRSLGFAWRNFEKDIATAIGVTGTDRGQYSPTGANLARILSLLPPRGEAPSFEGELAAGLRLFFPTTTEGATKIAADKAFTAWVTARQKTEAARANAPAILW